MSIVICSRTPHILTGRAQEHVPRYCRPVRQQGAVLRCCPQATNTVQSVIQCSHQSSILTVGQTSSSAESAAAPAEPLLHTFLEWLVANGVEGVGRDDSKVVICQQDNGERGLVCTQDIAREEVILRVPLHLTITDRPTDEDSNAVVYPGAPRTVRLATKLLRMCKQGSSCPWYPYLQVLPRSVPSLHTLSQRELQAAQYPPMMRDYEHACCMLSSAWQQLSAEATGGASQEELDWALAIVHSRSFGGPGEGAAAGCMLVPLVELLNHAGNEIQERGGGSGIMMCQRDNVRWAVKAPAMDEGGGGSGCMVVVSAKRDILAGEELLLTYVLGSNDYFLEHYGFVPPRNPYDDVILFETLEEAVLWLWDKLTWRATSAQPASPEELSSTTAITAALDAVSRCSQSVGPQLSSASQAESEDISWEESRVRLMEGGRLDGRLMVAFEALVTAWAGTGGKKSSSESIGEVQGDQEAVPMLRWRHQFYELIELRCRQLLESMPTSLLTDLELLAEWEEGQGAKEGHGFADMLWNCRASMETYGFQTGTTANDSYRTRSECGAALPAAASADVYQRGSQEDLGSAVTARVVAFGGADQQHTQQAADPGAASAFDAVAQGGEQLVWRSILPVIYRAYKKIILWETILATPSAACFD